MIRRLAICRSLAPPWPAWARRSLRSNFGRLGSFAIGGLCLGTAGCRQSAHCQDDGNSQRGPVNPMCHGLISTGWTCATWDTWYAEKPAIRFPWAGLPLSARGVGIDSTSSDASGYCHPARPALLLSRHSAKEPRESWADLVLPGMSIFRIACSATGLADTAVHCSVSQRPIRMRTTCPRTFKKRIVRWFPSRILPRTV